jgi:hypothetical protein
MHLCLLSCFDKETVSISGKTQIVLFYYLSTTLTTPSIYESKITILETTF